MDRLAQPQEAPTAAAQKHPSVLHPSVDEEPRPEIAIRKPDSIAASSAAAGRGEHFPATEELRAKMPKIKRFRTPSLL